MFCDLRFFSLFPATVSISPSLFQTWWGWLGWWLTKLSEPKRESKLTGSCFLTRRNSQTWNLKLNFVFWLHFIYSHQSVFYLPVNLLRTSAIVGGENVLIYCEKTDIWETFAFAYPCRVLTCCSKSNAKNSIWKGNIEIQWYEVVNVFILLQRPEVVLFFSSPLYFRFRLTCWKYLTSAGGETGEECEWVKAVTAEEIRNFSGCFFRLQSSNGLCGPNGFLDKCHILIKCHTQSAQVFSFLQSSWH